MNEQPLVVIPDANVLIHGKALVDLPWAEFCRSKIEVLFVHPVIKELDKLKNQTGRQNKIARNLSSEIRTLINTVDQRIEVRRADPTVYKRIELRPVTEPLNDTLSLNHADQALINYALWLQQEGYDVLLLTDDTICGATAQGVGLSVKFLPDSWKRPPEPDERDKENARLRAELQRLSSAAPKVELSFCDTEGNQLTELEATLKRWPALTESELDELLADVQRLCPQATSFEPSQPSAKNTQTGRLDYMPHLSAITSRSVYEPATEEEIQLYKTQDYPNWLKSVRSSLAFLHQTLEERSEWPVVIAVAKNTGTRPATDTLLTIHARGAIRLFNSEECDEDADNEEQARAKNADFKLPLPPAPPRGRTKTTNPFWAYHELNASNFATARQIPFDISNFPPIKPRELDAFYWRLGQSDWVKTMELECSSWRHGQEPVQFAFKVYPEEKGATSAVIEISVHANNIADPRVARLPIRINYEDRSTLDKGRALVEQLGRTTSA